MKEWLPNANLPEHKNWNRYIDEEVVKCMAESKRGARYDFTNFTHLIRFIRNLLEHYTEILSDNPQLPAIVGSSQEEIMRYFVRCFPWLMITMYILEAGIGNIIEGNL